MQFLLERLAAPNPAPDALPAFDLAAAVAAQVQRIVGARLAPHAGDALDLPGFGMASVVELADGDRPALEAFAERLGRLIARYEPRLAEPQVSLDSVPGTLSPLRLLVRGRLADGAEHAFRFDLPTR